MSYEYDYIKTVVNLDKLSEEIDNYSPITTSLDYITWEEPSNLSIFFQSELTSFEEEGLDTVVTNHDGSTAIYCHTENAFYYLPNITNPKNCPNGHTDIDVASGCGTYNGIDIIPPIALHDEDEEEDSTDSSTWIVTSQFPFYLGLGVYLVHYSAEVWNSSAGQDIQTQIAFGITPIADFSDKGMESGSISGIYNHHIAAAGTYSYDFKVRTGGAGTAYIRRKRISLIKTVG